MELFLHWESTEGKMGNLQIPESFVQLISLPGPCQAGSPVISNFLATSFPSSPWAALAWKVQRGERQRWGGEQGRRALLWLKVLHFLRFLLFMCSVKCG